MTESHKHAYAKAAVARWLREQYDLGVRPASYQVFVEYPICVDAQNTIRGLTDIWAECGEFAPRTPSYQECIDTGLLPLVIFDVAVFYKGVLTDAYEIVHTNTISPAKAQNLYRINDAIAGFDLWLLDAAWVLSRADRVDLPLTSAKAWYPG